MNFFTTIQDWLDENLWLLIAAFIGLYAFVWIIFWITFAVDFIFARKTNGIEKAANRIYPFCQNLCKNILYAGGGFIILAIILRFLIALFT